MEEYFIKIKDKAGEVIEVLGFSGDPIVTKRDNVFFVNFQIDEPMLLIGRNGEVLDSLQHVLRLLLYSELEGQNLVVDINGYRARKTDMLEKRVREIARKVVDSGTEEELPPMNSYERRIVHTIITNIADVDTESLGERDNRRVKIKPKKKK
jgi:spoIIIJ-associated protein